MNYKHESITINNVLGNVIQRDLFLTYRLDIHFYLCSLSAFWTFHELKKKPKTKTQQCTKHQNKSTNQKYPNNKEITLIWSTTRTDNSLPQHSCIHRKGRATITLSVIPTLFKNNFTHRYKRRGKHQCKWQSDKLCLIAVDLTVQEMTLNNTVETSTVCII